MLLQSSILASAFLHTKGWLARIIFSDSDSYHNNVVRWQSESSAFTATQRKGLARLRTAFWEPRRKKLIAQIMLIVLKHANCSIFNYDQLCITNSLLAEERRKKGFDARDSNGPSNKFIKIEWKFTAGLIY